VKPQRRRGHREDVWLALEIGNSRLHWALFSGDTLYRTWDTEYFSESLTQQLAKCQTIVDFPAEIFPLSGMDEEIKEKLLHAPIFVASVVPQQTQLWETHPDVRVIRLEQIPLLNMYPTLGIDRAIAVWGAGKTWGFPVLVIDAGTALTFTGANGEKSLVGGAILPGLGLQFSILSQKTAQLPQLNTENITLPPRFACNTPAAIQSGIIYTLLAGIKDFMMAWWELFPNSKIVIKGGDRTVLFNYLQMQFPEITKNLIVEANLTFWGIREIIN
jgi:type III pantothenate kinase